jgi:ATP-dependent DNA helicase RecQ
MSVFRQLLSAGLLSVDLGNISGFRLTEKGWEVLKRKRDIVFRKDFRYSKAQTDGCQLRADDGVVETADSRHLFETLRKLRLDISRQLQIPPYIIFHDKSLKEMASFKPKTTSDFLQITGVGESKAQRFSDIFLACIRGEKIDMSQYLNQIRNPVSENTAVEKKKDEPDERKRIIVELLRENKLTSAEIAERVGVSPPTVWAYKANLTMGKYDDIPLENNGYDSVNKD